jgi:hypothetical protein
MCPYAQPSTSKTKNIISAELWMLFKKLHKIFSRQFSTFSESKKPLTRLRSEKHVLHQIDF